MTDIATATLERSSEPAPAKRRDGGLHTRLRRVLLLAVALSFAACVAIDVLVLRGANTDMWFHLSTGAWITQHHHVPINDPFSADGIHKTYIAYIWLFSVTLYWFYRWFGLVGTSAYVVLLATGTGLALYRAIQRRMGGFAGPIALTAAGIFVMVPLYSERPWLFSMLFFVIELDILFAELVDPPKPQASWRIWLLPPLFALWANMHIQWVYGLAVLGLAALTQDVEIVRKERGLRLAWNPSKRWYRLWVATGLCFLATFVNPYTWRLYEVVLEYGRERVPLKMIQEMQAPDFRSPLHYLLVLLVLGAAFVLGRRRVRSSVFVGALFVAAVLASLRTARDVWFAVAVASMIIAVGYRKDPAAPAEVPLPRFHRFAAAVLAVLLVFSWAGRRDLSNRHLQGLVEKHYPVKAAEFVSQQGIPGPLYNDYNWGGYLLWRLPQLPVSMDGRAWVYGDARVERNIETWNCEKDWKNDPELTSANVVIGSVNARLSTALKEDPRFKIAYDDGIAIVFVKRRT